ncbi:MAG: hypothetical protein EOP34_06465, partial [Rickettsiales bacterium]
MSTTYNTLYASSANSVTIGQFIKANGNLSGNAIQGINATLTTTGTGANNGNTVSWEILLYTTYGTFELLSSNYSYIVGNIYNITWSYEPNLTTDIFQTVVINRLTGSSTMYSTQIYSGSSITTFSLSDTCPASNGSTVWIQSTNYNTISYPSILSNDIFSRGSGTFVGSLTSSNFNGSSTGINSGDIYLSTVSLNSSVNAAVLNGQMLTLTAANASNPGVVTASSQSFGGLKTFTTGLTISASTTSTSSTTGALIITGGIGIGGNINVGASTVSTSKTTGAIVVAGGVGISGSIYTGGIINVTATTASTNATTGALIVAGGVGITGATYHAGVTTVTNTTASTSTTTGALIVAGGMGIGGTTYCSGIYFPTIGGTASMLSYYEEYTSTLTLVDSANSISFSVNITIVKSGRNATLMQSGSGGNKTPSSASTFVSSAALPTRFIPTLNQYGALPIVYGGSNTIGFLLLDTAGKITIAPYT